MKRAIYLLTLLSGLVLSGFSSAQQGSFQHYFRVLDASNQSVASTVISVGRSATFSFFVPSPQRGLFTSIHITRGYIIYDLVSGPTVVPGYPGLIQIPTVVNRAEYRVIGPFSTPGTYVFESTPWDFDIGFIPVIYRERATVTVVPGAPPPPPAPPPNYSFLVPIITLVLD